MEPIKKVDEELNSASIETFPDDLLIHILSFLPMKEAVLTSVLSKRWRNLFAFSHNFDFDNPFISFYRNRGRWDENVKSLWNFMYRTLSMEEGSQCKKLSIKFKNIDPKIVKVFWNKWICYALKHGVSELHIQICDSLNSILSLNSYATVFNSTKLVKLSLGRVLIINSVPSDTYLPSLKVLLLDEIGFERAQLAQLFFAACPALEDLTIHELYHEGCSYTISSPTIKKLSFSRYYFYRNNFVSFDTPNVVDLCYSDHPRVNSTKYSGFDSLVKTTLDLQGCFGNSSWYAPGVDVVYVKNLIIGIRNVKTLHLTYSSVEVILNSVCCKDVIPVFDNLVYLEFSSSKKGLSVLLPRLIERSPNLKVLVLFFSVLDRYIVRRRKRRWFVNIRIPLENQIEMLSIKQYGGREKELQHISHLLLNMKSLRVLKVYVLPKMDEPRKLQLTEDLMKLPTVSPKLKIQVLLDAHTNELFNLNKYLNS